MADKKKKLSPLEILSGKSGKKDDEKKVGRKGGKHKETHIKHHPDGSHTVSHVPVEPGGEEVSYARPDLNGVISGLKENLSPEGGGAEPSPASLPMR